MKRFVFLLFLVIFFTACKSTSPIVTSKKGTSKEKLSRSEKRKTNQLAEQLIDAAADNLGVKYKYAGTTKAGYDCSGLMYTIFNAENITLPRNSLQQSKIGVVLNPKKDKDKKGILLSYIIDYTLLHNPMHRKFATSFFNPAFFC